VPPPPCVCTANPRPAVAKKSINNCLKQLTNAVGRDAAAAVRACPRHFAVVQESEGN